MKCLIPHYIIQPTILPNHSTQTQNIYHSQEHLQHFQTSSVKKQNMLNHKKLMEKAKNKWWSANSSVACKGHIVVYTMDDMRFMVPVSYLSSDIFREMFHLAEELFGLPSDGHVRLPCDADFLQNVIYLHKRRSSSRDVERDLLNFISSSRCSASPLSQGGYQTMCSF